jgi:phosphatidylglycerophosphate synthase
MATSRSGGDRIQTNLLAGAERRLLDRLCAACPRWVTPDQLTLLTFLSALIIFFSYAASRYDVRFLLLAAAGYFLHWFGDSMDGSLARYRAIERPRYGYFVDHGSDQLGNFLVMAGLGLTYFVRMDVALYTIGGYMVLSIYVFLNEQATKTYQMSFNGLSPTELRIGLVLLTLAMPYAGRRGWSLWGQYFTIFDILLLLMGTGFFVVFVYSFLLTAKRLRAEGL